MEREKLFSVTAKDCDWSYTRGTGNGGQKKNKTSSAVHCTHRLSGAHGYSEETRSQHQNKSLAFQKMAETPKFKKWLEVEIARANGTLIKAEEYANREIKNIRVEVKEDGKWVEVPKEAELPND